MNIDMSLTLSAMTARLEKFWKLATQKVRLLESEYDPGQGSPVFTVEGRYTTRGWTEWTQGFQYGIPLLIFGATGDIEMLELGKRNTVEKMAPHVTHFGVHDHGFNNLSTYGTLLRLARMGLFESSPEEQEFYKLAIKVSGAVQAKRWTPVKEGGFIHSFNGPHSLFIDTLRTCRILLAAHRLGHRMLDEDDREADLLERAITHGLVTAKYAVYYGEGRDRYDVRGRVAHESLFNARNGNYRCPSSQQGYSAFTTWTRGLAWAMLGFSEFLEFLATVDPSHPDLEITRATFLKAARATCDFYIENSAADGIPCWDTGAPGLHQLGRYREKPADPFNAFEPVDSSAAAIGAQGLLRLGRYLDQTAPNEVALKEAVSGEPAKYFQAGLTILNTLLSEPYLSTSPLHQGILLHTVYHMPSGWDHIPEGQQVPSGEAGMWGDYHITELCYTVQRLIDGDHYTFFEGL